jgi:hypothetical protein
VAGFDIPRGKGIAWWVSLDVPEQCWGESGRDLLSFHPERSEGYKGMRRVKKSYLYIMGRGDKYPMIIRYLQK